MATKLVIFPTRTKCEASPSGGYRLVDIHRENRRDAIHHRSQGAYNRSGQRGEGYAFHADGQQIAQQPRISLIRLAQGSIQANAAMPGITTSKGISNLMTPANAFPIAPPLYSWRLTLVE